MNFGLVFLLLLIVVVGLPLAVSWVLYRWLKKRVSLQIALTLAAIPTLLIGYFILTAIYPNDEFYEEEFTRITGLAYPAEADIVDKDATYPDQFGDYASCARIEVPPAVYHHLRNQLLADSRFSTVDSLEIQTSASEHVRGRNNPLTYKTRFTRENPEDGAFMVVGFVADQKTLIIERSSS